MIKSVLVWGSGGYYMSRKYWIPNTWNILAYIHGQPDVDFFENKKVIYPSEISKYEYDIILVAVTNCAPILEILHDMNIPDNKIEILTYHYEWFFPRNEKKILRMFYSQTGNVGDILNGFLYERLYGIKTLLTSIETAEAIGTGSILESLYRGTNDEINIENPITVLGSGLMYEADSGRTFKRELSILALRGEKTRDGLSKILDKKIDCVLADPGLLVEKLNVSREKKFMIGIVPHYIDYDNMLMVNLAKNYNNDVKYINVRNEPMQVIKEIASCEVIISSSLHGLIIADSLNIPNLWVECSDKVLGKGYKFFDYYSSYGLSIESYDLRKEQKFPSVEYIKEKYKIPREIVEQKQGELEQIFKSL